MQESANTTECSVDLGRNSSVVCYDRGDKTESSVYLWCSDSLESNLHKVLNASLSGWVGYQTARLVVCFPHPCPILRATKESFVQVQMAVINPDLARYGVIMFNVDFDLGGSVITSYFISSTPARVRIYTPPSHPSSPASSILL